jgi:two-component system, NarL family, sensor histidine kinase FusK
VSERPAPNSSNEQAFPSASLRARLPKLILIMLAAGVMYFLTGKLGLRVAYINPSASPVWAPTGIAIAAILIGGFEVWPAILLAAFMVNLTTAGSIWTSLGVSVGNTLEAVVGAYFLLRFARGRRAFERAEDVFKFAILTALGATTISATIGLLSLKAGGFVAPGTFGSAWITWWLGDVVGALVVAPCIILWSRPLGTRSFRQMAHAGLATISVIIACVLLFGGSYDHVVKGYPLEFLCFPLVVWMAFSARPQVSATTVLALAILAIRGTLLGYGSFGGHTRDTALLLLQAFMGVVAMTSLVVSAVVHDRNRNMSKLKKSKDSLEFDVAVRTAELELRVAEQRLVEDTLRQLSARLRRLQDEERQKISRELHDAVGQTLTALLMNLAVIERRAAQLDDRARSALADCKEQAVQATREIRTMSYLLHPPLLSEAGLAPALDWFVGGFAQRSGIKVDLEIPHEMDRLSDAVEISLFRIVQESLTNVHRHSNTRRASVRIWQEGNEITLEIRDDGSGAKPAREGLGITGMRERMTELGGNFQFNWTPDGTTVRASVPVSVAMPSSSATAAAN